MGTHQGQARSAASPPLAYGRVAAVAVLAVILGGCAGQARVLPIRLDPATPRAAVPTGPLTSYDAAARSISTILVGEFGLPLPAEFTVFVYPGRAQYARGLAQAGQMPAPRAAEIAGYSVGLGQRRRLFINEEPLRGAPPAAWLSVVAHELTHLAQYELSGGYRGRSEQWLREGMADWVACQVLERLGEGTFVGERSQAIAAVALNPQVLQNDPPDLVELGQPHGWEARHLRSGGHLTYGLAFLMTDELIRRHGFDRVIGYFRAFADSDDRFGNFQRVFGVSLREFEQDALTRIQNELAERRNPLTRSR